jgi:glutathione peroxidase
VSTEPYDAPVTTLGGGPADLHDFEGQAILVVNTASQCGLTPQYAGLQRLQDRYTGRGFTVLAFPCNQFGRQEPGSADDIRAFCRDRYAGPRWHRSHRSWSPRSRTPCRTAAEACCESRGPREVSERSGELRGVT